MWEFPNDQELPPCRNPVITNEPFSSDSFLFLHLRDRLGCFRLFKILSNMTGLLFVKYFIENW